MLSNHLILCHPLLLLPAVFLITRVFSSDSALHIMQPKSWSFSFSISPSNEYSGLISFRIDWFDILAVPGIKKNFLLEMFTRRNSFKIFHYKVYLSTFYCSYEFFLYMFWGYVVSEWKLLSHVWLFNSIESMRMLYVYKWRMSCLLCRLLYVLLYTLPL